jgi:hypothetical protein
MLSQDLDGALIECLRHARALEQMGLRVLEEGCRLDPDETSRCAAAQASSPAAADART